MEIEFKLSCTPPTASALHQYFDRFADAPAQIVYLRNTYYDTPDQALRAAGIALRIRKQGRLRLQTVKCAGQVSGGLSSRPEWESTYRGDFDFSGIEDASVRKQLETLSQQPGLRATLDTDFQRCLWHWQPDSTSCVEVALDRGTISAGGKQEAICELELELLRGTPARLFELVAQLARQFALFPAPLSKATRGNLLLGGQWPAYKPGPSSAVNVESAFGELAQTCLDHISLNVPTNCRDFNAENLHQVRVGLRRFRALLELSQPILKRSGPSARLAEDARRHMRLLGPARNAQVVLDTLIAPAEIAIAASARQQLQQSLEKVRHKAFVAARAHLGSLEFAQWLLEASLTIHIMPIRRKQIGRAWAPLCQSLLHKRLPRFARKLAAADANPASLHALRKSAKHLRYQLLVSSSGDKATMRLADSINQLQTILGLLNDLYSASDTFATLPAANYSAIAALGSAHQARHLELQRHLGQAKAVVQNALQKLQRPSRKPLCN